MGSKKTTLLLIKILEKIISDSSWHGRWLNTLSFLEYIGNRKMLKSLPAEHLNLTLLTHIQEESRHSLFFKKLAEKTWVKNLKFKPREMICSKQAESYFQKVDQAAERVARSDVILNYLYTTYLIETRALAVYQIYNNILEKNGMFSIKAILQEEEHHLDEVTAIIREKDPLSEYNLEKLRYEEHSLYFNLLHELEEELEKEELIKMNNSIHKNSSENIQTQI